MNRENCLVVFLTYCLIGSFAALAQEPSEFTPSTPAETSPPSTPERERPSSSGSDDSGTSSFLGKSVPFFDPGSDTIMWDGKVWNINNNRVFEARFDKYLNAPESEDKVEREYQAVLDKILDKLSPFKISPTATDEAYRMLAQAASFQADGKICYSLANQIYSSWLTRRSNDRLMAANKSLEEERKKLEWNARRTAEGNSLSQSSASGNAEATRERADREKESRDLAMQSILSQLAEIQALRKANNAKKELAELQVKIEFQTLLVQLFMQRRFQHVLIGTCFYRNIFNDGDNALRLEGNAKDIFAKTTGLPPTLTTIETFAGEAMRDIDEGMKSFDYLMGRDELASATKRLAEIFVMGEFAPSVRLLAREKKQKITDFKTQSYQLLSALEVKDYTLAEELVTKLRENAKDFDFSKPKALIETSKRMSMMHIAKARNAAVNDDKETLEKELKAAAEIWPTNPALEEVAGKIFEQGDQQARALLDFDQLLAQKNFRQIAEDRMRFVAAIGLSPEANTERQEKLKQVLDDIQTIETALGRAQEFEKMSNPAGAWESVERAARTFPEDVKLNAARATLTAKAADFVSTLQQGEALEERKQYGSALACYLNARLIYPPSEFADEGIKRIVAIIIPDAS